MEHPNLLATAVAAEVRARIEDAGLSQREVAAATTIPLVTLSRRLTGAGRPFDLVELAAIAAVLGVSVTELFIKAESAERAA